MIGDLEKLREAILEDLVTETDFDTVSNLDLTPFALPTDDATPETDEARAAHQAWVKYAEQYVHIPEAMVQAPKDADPFAVAERLERQRNALQAKLAEREAEVRTLHDNFSKLEAALKMLRQRIDIVISTNSRDLDDWREDVRWLRDAIDAKEEG